jgi:hypothetical protein
MGHFSQSRNVYGIGWILYPNQGYNLSWKNHIRYNLNMKTSKLKKIMSSGSCLIYKLYDKIIKMLSKSHETIPLNTTGNYWAHFVTIWAFTFSKKMLTILKLILGQLLQMDVSRNILCNSLVSAESLQIFRDFRKF